VICYNEVATFRLSIQPRSYVKGGIIVARSELTAMAARLRLENGSDSEGNIKYINQSIQRVSDTGYTDDKFMALVAAIEPVLAKTIGGAQKTATYNVFNA